MLESNDENESSYDLTLDRVYFWILLEIFETLREGDLVYCKVL